MAKFTIQSEQLRAIMDELPSVKPQTISNKYHEYKSLIIEEMITNIMWRNKVNGKTGQLNETMIHEALGSLNKGKVRVKPILDKHCKLFTAPKFSGEGKGTGNGKITHNVKFHIPMKEVYEYIMTENVAIMMKNINEHLLLADTTPEFWMTIDMDSLKAYIVKTEESLATLTNPKEIQTRQEYLVYAGAILQIASQFDGKLPQYGEIKNTGRIYYQGINLQSCPKVVRYAALGNCSQYDFRANSYTLLLEMAIRICVNDGIATRDQLLEQWGMVVAYIQDRSNLRKQIASDIFNNDDEISIKKIKTAFTMFGFGAKAVNNPFNSIGKAIGDKETTDKFLNHYIFKPLQTQFSQICDIVYTECEQNQVFYNVLLAEDEKCGNNGILKRNLDAKLKKHDNFDENNPLRNKPFYGKVLAYAYQTEEASLIKAFVELFNHSGEILWLHDGVVMRGDNKKTWQLVISEIQNMYPLVNVDRDIFNCWAVKDEDEKERIRLHRELINEQERLAKYYKSGNPVISKSVKGNTSEFDAMCSFMGVKNNEQEHVLDALNKASKEPTTMFNELLGNQVRH